MDGPDIWLLDGQQRHQTSGTGASASGAESSDSLETTTTTGEVGPIGTWLASTNWTRADLELAMTTAQTVLYLVVAYYAVTEGS